MKRINFNDNWLLVRDDSDEATEITLPHDAMIHGRRSAASVAGGAQGYFCGGAYIYEKYFDAKPDWLKQYLEFQFEGVYKNAKVYLNGSFIGGAAYGYIPFFVSADGMLREGKNVLRVECENLRQPDSRWYTGAGIYRPVWLWAGEKCHIKPEGVRVTTLSYLPARISVDVEHTGGEDCEILAEIFDGNALVASGSAAEFDIPAAKLWSDEDPHLYRCLVTLKQGGRVCDTAEVSFGIRKIEWSGKGLFVNGKSTLLRGGCVHHDSGILGAATYAESEHRRVEKLKAAGFNAIRSSHNPASEALLKVCDELGMYVIDEAWDMWYNHKNAFDYASDWRANHEADLAAMVSRDYNHPCVLMYSIGNEVSEPAKPDGVQAVREMTEYLHLLDASRAVTGGLNLMIISSASKGKGIYDDDGGRKNDNSKKLGGMNSTLFNLITSMVGTGMNKAANSEAADAATSPALDALDIAGYNYASGRYPLEGKAHPNRVLYGSETFPQDIAKNWAMVEKYPYLIGDFMWTAWDYIGEVGLGAWAYTQDAKGFSKPYPWLLADCGAFDILGNPNGEAFWAQAVWHKLNAPAVAVQPVNHLARPVKGVWRGTNAIPCWSWRGCEGKKAVVEVYFDCDHAELLLNGTKIGRAKAKSCRCVFNVKYYPGKLEAVAYASDGHELGRSRLDTALRADIHISPEKRMAKAGEILYLPVSIGDGLNAEGNADEMLKAAVTGGKLLAFGSANPRTEQRFDSGCYTSYYGRALAVVRAGKSGVVTLTVTSAGSTAEASVPILS